ncbi:MAG: Phosphoenolpyruvate carboxylase [Myxococcaceae bacterium]|nr:Phosphoenolpyruvate carboxylase [Myxococcaceae bacterium]
MTRTPPDDAPLNANIALLTDILDATIEESSGKPTLARVREFRSAAIALRDGALEGGRAAFQRRISALTLDELGDLARAFTQWFHLVNAAEEQHRIRLLRRHTRDAAPEGSLAQAIETFAREGLTAEQVRGHLQRLFVMPVLTAHPTEARRRTMRDHLIEVKKQIDALEVPLGPRSYEETLEQLSLAALALYGTEESRATKPSPRDEIEASLDVFRLTLLDASPALYRELEQVLTRTYPGEDWLGAGNAAGTFPVPSFLQWGTWIGGDRDGNPFVTAHVTRTVLERNRTLVLERYLVDVDTLGRTLSLSARRVPDRAALAELEGSIAKDRERFPEVAAKVTRFTVHEPWREKLWYMAARLRATKARTDEAYVDAAAYQRDLLLLERSLIAAGQRKLAGGVLRDCRRRADVFGFYLACLDLRQHSGLHERAVTELMHAEQLDGSRPYSELSEEERVALLEKILSRPESIAVGSRAALTPDTQDMLATLDMVGRARREMGPRACQRYIVSFTMSLSDLLEVLFLQRMAGLSPGELRPIPLLEQLEDVQNAATIGRQMLHSPAMRAAIGNELEVMLGYSDSCKQVGYVASQVALRAAQHELADLAEQEHVILTIFHGRGGAIGRGGGPSHRAIRAQPERALRGRLRVTEQGETINARYGRREIAQRDLEQVTSAVLLAGLNEQPLPPEELAARDALFDEAAAAALVTWKKLLEDPDKVARYAQAATPINEVIALPIGSRPSSRKKGLSLSDLRAVPWVFSWNQSRHGLPGWYGLGSALEAVIRNHGVESLREMYKKSPFFRALINNAQLALSRADIEVAACYAELGDPEVRELFPQIRAEWDKPVRSVLSVLDKQQILGNRPHLLSTVLRRNPYVDVLSHAQIELKRRLAQTSDEAERERILGLLFTTINGIAAGLQSAG